MEKLKIGVLGVSNHLIKRIVLPLRQTQHCYIEAIASRDISKAKECAETFNINKAYGDYQELLDDASIDMVYIPLPNHMHLEWIEKAAIAGKHILCEKPIALDAEQAQESMDICSRHNVKLMEAFMYKFHPQWIYAKDVVKTKQIGDIKYINSSFAYNNPAPNNIRNIKEYGGGAVMDIGCYAISVPRFILDTEPQKVMGIQVEHDRFGTDILSSAIMDFNGVHSTFNVSTLSHPNQYVEIVGTAGRIRVEIPFNTYVDTKAQILISTGQGDRILDFDICDQYGLMFDAFAQAIKNDKPVPHHPQDAINNMKVIDAVFKSSQSGKWENV